MTGRRNRPFGGIQQLVTYSCTLSGCFPDRAGKRPHDTLFFWPARSSKFSGLSGHPGMLVPCHAFCTGQVKCGPFLRRLPFPSQHDCFVHGGRVTGAISSATEDGARDSKRMSGRIHALECPGFMWQVPGARKLRAGVLLPPFFVPKGQLVNYCKVQLTVLGSRGWGQHDQRRSNVAESDRGFLSVADPAH